MEILRCKKVSKVYGDGDNRVAALNQVDLSVEKGEFVAVVGASGSGKSTLLHILGSVDKPSAGKVVVGGTDIASLSRKEAAIFRRRKVGLVYQFYNLIPTLTVRKNILMPLLLDKRKVNEEYFDKIVSALGLKDRLEALPNQLSGGQQQRTAIARSLIYRPALLLADEPTGNLDRKNSREIVDMLKLSNRNLGQTILLITHDERIALEADRILILTCISLILVIHNAFAVSMQNRMHQFGIFSSIGATPGQILVCLLQEAFMLSIYSIPAGILAGILAAFGTVQAMGAFAENLAGGRRMDFSLHPAIFAAVLLLSFLTVLVSAWIPTRKLKRLSPLEAIRGSGELPQAKRRKSRLLSAFFGIEGELAGNALRTQKKALRTTTLSLILAFLGFMLMQCAFTLSDLSTGHTYFEAYQDAWDVMVTVKDVKIEDFALTEKIGELEGIRSFVVYQKAEASCLVPADRISPELLAKGGPEAMAGLSLSTEKNAYLIEVPLVILDDRSFAEYCGQIGVGARPDGVVVYNRIWDSIDSNFRYPEYLPYIKGDTERIEICGIEIPVLACSGTPPVLREEYRDYALVQFMPLSLWKELSEQIGGEQPDLFVRVIADDRASLASLDALERAILQVVGEKYQTESENRIQEKQDNDKMIWGYKMILGGLCVLFALIGIANMFANTLGFLSQRKREFARLLSVGLTPEGIRKVFCIEALWLVGRPFLSAFILTIVTAAYMIKISYLDPLEFLREAPVEPVLVFALVVFGFTAFAYYLGGKKIFQLDLAAALRDDIFL